MKTFLMPLLLLMSITSKGEDTPAGGSAIFSTASVGDRVWLDADGDGIQEAGEPGFGGLVVILNDANGNAVATTVTGSNGYYSFPSVDAGVSGKSYSVWFRLPAGYHFSPHTGLTGDPVNSDADVSTGLSPMFTLLPGESNTSIDAGLRSLANGTLPLHRLDLMAALRGNSVTLTWVAENEMNTNQFIIERSTDGLSYNDIAVTAVAGQTNTPTTYSFITDIQLLASFNVIYYRIKAEDNSHRFAYSNVAPLRLNKITGIRVWPNPFVKDIRLSYNCSTNTVLNVKLADHAGRIAWQGDFELSRGLNQLSLTGVDHLPTGIYFIHVTDKNTNQTFVEKLMK